MDIQHYLFQKQRDLAQASRQIRDGRVFDFNYIPPKPLMREELKPVIEALVRYQQTGIANHLLILGSRGSGKSVLARALMHLLSPDQGLHFAYANCRQHNTSFKILASLLGVRPRGCSLDELWQRFCRWHPGPTVFILDEIDLMSEKDKNKDILYLISRCPNNYMAILLSNNPKFLSAVDESTRSSLQPEMIHFRNYRTDEIAAILQDRAHTGLTVQPEEVTSQIAALTVKNTNSDVRVAIKTLYRWALAPEVPLAETFEIARRDILVDVIRDLNDKNLLILQAALSQPAGHVKEVYQAYRQISGQFHEEPFSYVHFYANLSYLQSLGLILLIATKVHRAYTNRIQLLFDPDLLVAICQVRFG